MAFSINRWVRNTVAFNSGQISTTINPSAAVVLMNGPAIFTYASAADSVATIAVANYFADVIDDLALNDYIFISGSDANNILIVSAKDADLGTISVVSFSTAGVVGTANIQDGAVTNAKIDAAAAIDFSKLAALPSGNVIIGSAATVPTSRAISGDISLSNTGVSAIVAGVIVNADLSATAAVAFSKLAALASGNILVGSAGNVPTEVTMSGDATIVASGALTIAAGAIDNAKVAAGAAIAFSKLATLASGNLLVGSAGGVATSVASSGDVTIIASGATAIGAGKVLSSMMSGLLIRYTSVAISAAEFNGMHVTPKQLVAAQGANTMLFLHGVDLLMTFVSAAYAAGGVAHIQYDSTTLGAGVIASTTLSAATFQAAASTGFIFNRGVVPQTFTTCVNKGLFISNITGAFTTGDSTFVAHTQYSVFPSV